MQLFGKTGGMRVAAAAIAATIGWASTAQAATVLDLTTDTNASGTINDAIFQVGTHQSTGTGTFNPFLRIQNGHGYNTSSNDIPSHFNVVDGGSSGHTRDLQFGEIGTVNISGTDYLGFRLDLNEPGGDNSLISLNALQLYTNASGGLNPDNQADLGTLRYDLGDNSILMDASLVGGSGSGDSDINFFIPLNLFGSVGENDFVYLYASFSDAGAGFEEFAAFVPTDGPPAVVVPLPAAAWGGLALLGMLGIGQRIRRRRLAREG